MKPVPISGKARIERQVLTLLRGGETVAFVPTTYGRLVRNLPVDASLADAFTQLRVMALRRELHLECVECGFASSDEIRLLGWIAEGQRRRNSLASLQLQPGLLNAVLACGMALKAAGVIMSSKAIYAGRYHAGYDRQTVEQPRVACASLNDAFYGRMGSVVLDCSPQSAMQVFCYASKRRNRG